MNKGERMRPLSSLILSGVLIMTCSKQSDDASPRICITPNAVHKIDSRLFGHFLEKHPDEIGPDGALSPSGDQLAEPVIDLLRQMHIPLIRFPGGYAVDYVNWTDFIDQGGSGSAGRPASHLRDRDRTMPAGFGYDEFFALCDSLSAQPLITVNIRDGLLKRRPLQEAARHEAGLVAYCNAPIGSALPEGVADWPGVRQANGRETPYNVRYFQIGNEPWMYLGELKKQGMSKEEIRDWIVVCIDTYVRALRSVDSTITIIIDGHMEEIGGIPDLYPAIREKTGDAIQYICCHRYASWGIHKVTDESGNPLNLDSLSDEEIWNAWVAAPEIDSATGMSAFGRTGPFKAAPECGWRIAATEWNWNGWWELDKEHTPEKPPLNSQLAKGIGAAGFLHAVMRAGDIIDIACQSMLVGKQWPLAGVFAPGGDPEKAFMNPTGLVTALYSRFHGDSLLEVSFENLSFYRQPLSMRWLRAKEKVSWVDVLCTRRENKLFVHCINRRFDESQPAIIDYSAISSKRAAACHIHYLNGDPFADLEDYANGARAEIQTQQLSPSEGAVHVALPPHSAAVVEIVL